METKDKTEGIKKNANLSIIVCIEMIFSQKIVYYGDNYGVLNKFVSQTTRMFSSFCHLLDNVEIFPDSHFRQKSQEMTQIHNVNR